MIVSTFTPTRVDPPPLEMASFAMVLNPTLSFAVAITGGGETVTCATPVTPLIVAWIMALPGPIA